MVESERGEPVRIVVLPGDGVGPEVAAIARRCFDEAAAREGLPVEWREYPCGGKHYLESGEEWSEQARSDCCQWADAVLLGAVGWPGAVLPGGDMAGAGVIFGLRFGFDLFANIRPVKLYEGVNHLVSGRFLPVWKPRDVDMVILRENTEGAYTPIRGTLDRGGTREVAVDSRVITRKGSERIIRLAFSMARERRGAPEDGRSRVTCVDKANVMAGCRLFREVFDEVAAEHPEIDSDHCHVDAFTQALMRSPEHYDVVVTTNMLGDIVTDLAAVLQGGMGVASSGNVGERHGMFESVHGSAPPLAGKDQANPIAEVLSAALLARWVAGRRSDHGAALEAVGEALEGAVQAVLREGRTLPIDLGGSAGTRAVGDALLEQMN